MTRIYQLNDIEDVIYSFLKSKILISCQWENFFCSYFWSMQQSFNFLLFRNGRDLNPRYSVYCTLD